MIDLTQYSELTVRQEVEHLEAFTGFETSNRYRISSSEGEPLLYAFEESGFLGRQVLKSHRPLTLHIVDEHSEPLLVASRSFFFFLSHLHISDGDGRPVGSLRRNFAVLKRRFTLEDPMGAPIAEVRGPIFRPNTFMIYRNDEEGARGTKQWSGIIKEAFTDADNFRVQQNTEGLGQEFALLILATALAIDLDFFEK